MVGAAYEQGGIIKHGAHMINAVSNSTVPALTVIVGASYGAGNYAMCGRAYNPRFLFAYPNSKIAVMGGEQLAGVMDIIRREAAAKQGQPYDEDQSAMIRQMVEQQMEQESNAFFASGQLWDDGIIDPRETRTVLGFCLEVVNLAGFEGTGEFGVFRM
jgi:acetyl-CoA carboxylase carboxyltransferase component